MTRAFKRDLAFAAALFLCLALYALFRSSTPVLGAVLAVSGLAVVVVHAIGADEIRRASAFRAGFIAFILAAGVCVGAAVLGSAGFLAGRAEELWAWLFALYLLSWTGQALVRR